MAKGKCWVIPLASGARVVFPRSPASSCRSPCLYVLFLEAAFIKYFLSTMKQYLP